MAGYAPAQPALGEGVRLIDWESWRVDTATDDLAYMMAMLRYPDRRRRMESRCWISTTERRWLTACAVTTDRRWTTTIACQCSDR